MSRLRGKTSTGDVGKSKKGFKVMTLTMTGNKTRDKLSRTELVPIKHKRPQVDTLGKRSSIQVS